MLASLLSASGCGDSEERAELEPVTIVLGTGTDAFEPVTKEQELTLYPGTQGGHHVWLSYRTTGLRPSGIRMELDVVPEPPARAARTDVVLDLVATPGAAEDGNQTYEFTGWPAQVLDPECAVGKRVRLALKITDSEGQEASGQMVVVAGEPEVPFTRNCTR